MKALLLTLLLCLMWGVILVIAKFLLSDIPPFLVLSLRLGIVMLFGLLIFPRPPLPIRKIFRVSFVFGVLHLSCMFWSLYAGLNASLGIVVEQLAIPFLLILSQFIFKDRIQPKTWVGISTAIFGTFVLMGSPESINNPYGFLLMVLSGFFWAVYSIELKKLPSLNPIHLMVWISVLSFPFVVTFSLLFEESHIRIIQALGWPELLGLLYLGLVASLLAHGLWYYLIQRYPVEKIAPLTLLVPVIGVSAGIIFLNDPMDKDTVTGTILVLTGLAIIQLRRPKLLKRDIDV